jgi:hypothetical protein
MVGRKLFNNVKNQVIWVSCIALVTVAVVGLFLTDVTILRKDRPLPFCLPPRTFLISVLTATALLPDINRRKPLQRGVISNP